LRVKLLLLSVLLAGRVFSLEVDQKLLEQVPEIEIEFENYVGPHLFYNSVSEIRGIGSYLAQKIDMTTTSNGNYNDKYLMDHYLKLEWENDLKSCDLFTISSTALIDNIENIKLILSQYLIDLYEYSEDDSLLLAKLLLVYNAVYRADGAHYSEGYTNIAINLSSPENLGIDLSYYNWPGKTHIFIPLSDNIEIGKLSTVDTDQIIDSSVIDHIKINNENDIALREDIVEYKEREFDEIKTEVFQEKIELDDKIVEIKDELIADPDNNELIQELEVLETEVEMVDVKEIKLKKKEEKILELRDDLAEDKNDLIEKKTSTVVGELLTFILNKKSGNTILGEVVDISETGVIINRGSVNTVRNSNFISIGSYLYVIAGGSSSNQIITLGRIDKGDISKVSWSETPCSEDTALREYKGKIYCTIPLLGSFYIGEFDKKLNLVRRSPIPMDENSYVTIKKDSFYIQGRSNSIKLVNLSEFIPIED